MYRMRVQLTTVILGIVASVCANSANATSLTILNPSFEAPIVPMDGDPNTTSVGDDFINALTTGALPGWQVSGNQLASLGQLTRKVDSFFENKLAPTPDPNDEEQSHWANRSDTYLYQVLSEPLLADTTYALRVDLGNRSDTNFPAGAQIRLGFGSTPGQNILALDVASNPIPGDGGWATWENVYVTGPAPLGLGQPLRIELISDGQQAQFDNVRLDAVPIGEPSSLVLCGVGMLGLGIFRWRRRRQTMARSCFAQTKN